MTESEPDRSSAGSSLYRARSGQRGGRIGRLGLSLSFLSLRPPRPLRLRLRFGWAPRGVPRRCRYGPLSQVVLTSSPRQRVSDVVDPTLLRYRSDIVHTSVRCAQAFPSYRGPARLPHSIEASLDRQVTAPHPDSAAEEGLRWEAGLQVLRVPVDLLHLFLTVEE